MGKGMWRQRLPKWWREESVSDWLGPGATWSSGWHLVGDSVIPLASLKLLFQRLFCCCLPRQWSKAGRIKKKTNCEFMFFSKIPVIWMQWFGVQLQQGAWDTQQDLWPFSLSWGNRAKGWALYSPGLEQVNWYSSPPFSTHPLECCPSLAQQSASSNFLPSALHKSYIQHEIISSQSFNLFALAANFVFLSEDQHNTHPFSCAT